MHRKTILIKTISNSNITTRTVVYRYVIPIKPLVELIHQVQKLTASGQKKRTCFLLP